MTNFKELTTAQFGDLLQEQNQYSTKKWPDLEKNKIYTITDYKTVETRIGVSMIISLLNNGEVWAPAHLKEKLETSEVELPYYIRPLGLKPCKDNKKNKYHAYCLIDQKKRMNVQTKFFFFLHHCIRHKSSCSHANHYKYNFSILLITQLWLCPH